VRSSLYTSSLILTAYTNFWQLASLLTRPAASLSSRGMTRRSGLSLVGLRSVWRSY